MIRLQVLYRTSPIISSILSCNYIAAQESPYRTPLGPIYKPKPEKHTTTHALGGRGVLDQREPTLTGSAVNALGDYGEGAGRRCQCKMSSVLETHVPISLGVLFHICKWLRFISVPHFSNITDTYVFKPGGGMYPSLPRAEQRCCPGERDGPRCERLLEGQNESTS